MLSLKYKHMDLCASLVARLQQAVAALAAAASNAKVAAVVDRASSGAAEAALESFARTQLAPLPVSAFC